MSAKKALKVANGSEPVKPKVIPRQPEWSQQDIDHQWEQIRIRGEQISADIAALRARINSP